MIDFLNSAFRGLFTVVIWILLIIVIIVGFIVIKDNPSLSFAIWVGGLISIILFGGLISMQIKMNENLQKIIDQGFIISENKITIGEEKGISGNVLVKICNNCSKQLNGNINKCPDCGGKDFSIT